MAAKSAFSFEMEIARLEWSLEPPAGLGYLEHKLSLIDFLADAAGVLHGCDLVRAGYCAHPVLMTFPHYCVRSADPADDTLRLSDNPPVHVVGDRSLSPWDVLIECGADWVRVVVTGGWPAPPVVTP